jgi:hypothetical protein
VTTIELAKGDRWASVSADLHPTVAQYRHVVGRGAVTSACGTTALPAATWRGNSTKPCCPVCVERVRGDR